MNKFIPVMLGLAILGGSAVMADEPAAKDAKAPAKTAKKAVKVKAAKKAKATAETKGAETKAPDAK